MRTVAISGVGTFFSTTLISQMKITSNSSRWWGHAPFPQPQQASVSPSMAKTHFCVSIVNQLTTTCLTAHFLTYQAGWITKYLQNSRTKLQQGHMVTIQRTTTITMWASGEEAEEGVEEVVGPMDVTVSEANGSRHTPLPIIECTNVKVKYQHPLPWVVVINSECYHVKQCE